MTTNEWPLGTILERARRAKHLSGRTAADACGISGRTWGNLVSGEFSPRAGVKMPYSPSAETLWKVARGLRLDPVELFLAAGLPAPDAAPPEPAPPLELARAAVRDASAALRRAEGALAQLGSHPVP